MFTSYCGHCGSNWTNETPNCPNCGAPDHSAKKIGPHGNENSMNDDDIDNDSEISFRDSALEGMKMGAAMAAASEANNLIKAGVTAAALQAGVPLKALESAAFQKGTPVVAAMTLLYLAQRFPDLIPRSEFVERAAQMALAEATKESIAPMISALTPTLMALAASGEKVALAEAAKPKDDDDDKSSTEDAYGDDDAVFEISPA